jgi:hypothetical protein
LKKGINFSYFISGKIRGIKKIIKNQMKLTKVIIFISLLLLGACSEKGETEKVLPDLVAKEKGKYNIVVFYEDELPSKSFQNDVNKARDYLIEKDKLEYLFYIDIKSYDFRTAFHGLTPPHVLIFDNEKATINATKPEVLFEHDL